MTWTRAVQIAQRANSAGTTRQRRRDIVESAEAAQPASAMTNTVIEMASVQTPPVNPKTLSWTWPTQATDQNGNQVALNLSDIAAVEVQFDGGAVIDVTAVTGSSGPQASLVLSTLPAFQALTPGQHTVDIAARTSEGAVGAFSAPVSFLIAVVPAAPSGITLA